MDSNAVAQTRQARPDTLSSVDAADEAFHSPVKAPDSVAVMIMNIWKRPQPIEVPREPRYVALMP